MQSTLLDRDVHIHRHTKTPTTHTLTHSHSCRSAPAGDVAVAWSAATAALIYHALKGMGCTMHRVSGCSAPAGDVTAALSGPEASIPPPPPTGFDQPPGRALEREKSFSFGK